MKKTAWALATAIMCCVFALPVFGGTWTASDDGHGNWSVRNGRLDAPSTVTIGTKDEKGARKLAKKLNNKAEKGKKKEGKGVKDDGDCPPGQLC